MRTVRACPNCHSPITADSRTCEVCAPVGEPDACSIYEIMPPDVHVTVFPHWAHAFTGLATPQTTRRPTSRN